MTSLKTALYVGLVVGCAKAAVILPFIDRYGWHRDELYFMAAGKHPSFGYVDFPPVTAWIAWVVHAIAGDSLVALRLTALAATIGTIVFVALTVRELGGSRKAQIGATVAVASTPFLLSAGTLFHTIWFDFLATTALLYVLVRVVGRPEPRLWPLAGLLAGVALEVKYTAIVVIVSFFLALLLTAPRSLLKPGPWVASGIAFLVVVPNLIWQYRNGWPSWDFFPSQHQATLDDATRMDYLTNQFLLFGFGLVVGLIGLAWLWRRPRLRPLALVPIFVAVVFCIEGGRAYYPMSTYLLPVAAGAIAIAGWVRRDKPIRLGLVGILAVAALVQAVIAFPKMVPVQGIDSISGTGKATNVFAEEIGWPEMTEQIADIWNTYTPEEQADTVILVGNYGEAGAISLFGPELGLPQPLSGHLSWQYWRPSDIPQKRAIIVGWPTEGLNWVCMHWEVEAWVDNGLGVKNFEYGNLIASCWLRTSLNNVWDPGIARSAL